MDILGGSCPPYHSVEEGGDSVLGGQRDHALRNPNCWRDRGQKDGSWVREQDELMQVRASQKGVSSVMVRPAGDSDPTKVLAQEKLIDL